MSQRLLWSKLLTSIVLAAALFMLASSNDAWSHDFGGNTASAANPFISPQDPCGAGQCCIGPRGGDQGAGNSGVTPTASTNDPVSLFTGAESKSVTDMVVSGIYPIAVTRWYNSQATYDSPLGYGWAFNHDRRMYEYPDNSVIVRHSCGSRESYVLTGNAYVSPVGGVLATLAMQGDGSYKLAYLSGVVDTFDSLGRLTITTDSQGNRHEYTYDSRGKLPLVGSSKESIAPTQPMVVASNYRLVRIDVRAADGALTGRFVTFSYNDTTGRLLSVTADDGRSITYQHDVTAGLTQGNLVQVNGLEGITSTYGYADPLDSHNMTSVVPVQGRTPLVNTYDSQDRVTRQVEGTRQVDINYQTAYTRTSMTTTVRDQNGLDPYTAVVTYEFDPSGRVSKQIDALGHETRYTYNAAKRLTRKEIWQNNGTTLSIIQAMDWTYDANGNKLTESVVLGSGEVVTRSWTYDNDWIASEQVVSSAAPTKIFRTEYTFFYGADGRPTNRQGERRRKDDGSFQITSYAYDSKNRLLAITLPDGVQIANEYTGDYVTHQYFVVSGSPIPQMDRRFEYDARGNLIKEWDARNNLAQHSYDSRRRLIGTTNPLGEQTLYSFSGDELTQIERGNTVAEGEGQVTRLVYDSRGHLTTVQGKDDAGAWIAVKSYQLNSEGRRVRVIDALSRITMLTYDLNGRLKTATDPLGKTTQYHYDAVGNRTSVVDALFRETKEEYDALNRVKATVQLGVSPSARTEYSYDAMGNLTGVLDPEGHATAYAYDALSRRTSETRPMGDMRRYEYDNRDRVANVMNIRGNKTQYEYAAWGAMWRERDYATISATSPLRTIEHSFDADGNVLSVTDSDVQVGALYATTYDALSRPYNETIKYLPGGDRILQHRHDRYGNRAQLTLQDSSPVAHIYSFNKLNRMTTATLAGMPIGVGYYANGDKQSVTLPGGVSQSYTYRSNAPIESINVTGPSGSLMQLTYAYDDVLNIDTLQDQDGVHDYNYDGLNRVTQAVRPLASGLPNESYLYDRVGNRKNVAAPTQWTYDNNNRLIQGGALIYTYDDDGNVQTRSDGASFTHNARNRLTGYASGSTTASYLYDARGRRIRKAVGSAITWFLWDGSNLLAEYDGAGNRAKRYGYLPGDYVATQLQDTNGTYYVHADHLQTPRLLTNSSGAIVWKNRFQAFGLATPAEDVDGNGAVLVFNLRFPGQYFDAETGNHYNFFRDYDPATGRYAQSDPIGLRGGVNTYAYVDGNPLSLIDRLGLQTCGNLTALELSWNRVLDAEEAMRQAADKCNEDEYKEAWERWVKAQADHMRASCGTPPDPWEEYINSPPAMPPSRTQLPPSLWPPRSSETSGPVATVPSPILGGDISPSSLPPGLEAQILKEPEL